jgi:hypothetical protein
MTAISTPPRINTPNIVRPQQPPYKLPMLFFISWHDMSSDAADFLSCRDI